MTDEDNLTSLALRESEWARIVVALTLAEETELAHRIFNEQVRNIVWEGK